MVYRNLVMIRTPTLKQWREGMKSHMLSVSIDTPDPRLEFSIRQAKRIFCQRLGIDESRAEVVGTCGSFVDVEHPCEPRMFPA